MKKARLIKFLLLTLVCLAVVLVLAPAQLPVVLYKLGLLLLGALAFWWLDMVVFPYSRPGSYLVAPWREVTEFVAGGADFEIAPGYELVFALATLRRAGLMSLGGALSMALGV